MDGSGRYAGVEGDWICANCGTVHRSNDQPCRECAGERFARLEAETTPRIDSAVAVEYECTECGQRQPRNSSPCSRCGNPTFDAVSPDRPGAESVDADESGRQITGRGIVAYLYGGLTLLNGLGWFYLSVLTGLAWVAGAAIALPPVRRRLESTLGIEMSTGAVIVLVGVLHAVAVVFGLAVVVA